MPTELTERAAVDALVRDYPICILYFTTPDCGVCTVLRPKLERMLAARFPAIGLGVVDCAAAPALAAQLQVFAVPTLVVFIDGREGLRKSRVFALEALADALARPYGLLTGDGGGGAGR